ncbi:unnamed protein product [Cunninghamella blakesleeana]
MRNTNCIDILLFILLFISFEAIVSGFCFYNELAENNLKVVQLDNFGRNWTTKFVADIPPNSAACCHYTNGDCNGRADSPNALTIFAAYARVEGGRAGLKAVYQLSGGYSIIKGDPHEFTVESYDGNHQPYYFSGNRAVTDENLPNYLALVRD